jgi:hypothetical protein
VCRGGRARSSLLGLVLAADNRLSELAARAGHELPGLSYWALCRRAEPGAAGADGHG